jgi:hypothetical protein
MEGSRVISVPLGLALTLPAPWEPKVMPAQPGVDFAAVHPPSGTFFAGYALVPESGASGVEATLREVLEGRRKKWGQLFDEQWGDEIVAGLKARWLAFTIERPDGRVRTKLWMADKGPYAIGFNCAGPESTFAESGRECRMLLDRTEAVGAEQPERGP